MMTPSLVLALLSGFALVSADSTNVPSKPTTSSQPFDGFVSFSIEFSSFPEYAGNLSYPNRYSQNLINDIRSIAGANPIIRVGGNTQDFALYNASQRTSLIGIIDPSKTPNYPTTVTSGKSFFESYNIWPGVQFSHGFNLGLGAKTSEGWQTLLDTILLACKALSHGNLYTWEYGNEPDFFLDNGARPQGWNETDMVAEWLNGTDLIRKQLKQHCPGLKESFMAPSNANTFFALSAVRMFAAGLNTRGDIELFSTHNYIDSANTKGVTLQRTLMNHTRTKSSVNNHITEYNAIFNMSASPTPPLILGEANSLSAQGRPGLSNTFGAALWGVNFNLYSASVGFKRIHMHQGTNFRYQAWQPVNTDLDPMGTKAPYDASMAVAHMTRRVGRSPVYISHVPLSADVAESAYAAHYSYRGKKKLARLVVVNMHGYNTTADGAGMEPLPRPPARSVRNYKFRVEGVSDGTKVSVHRLMANGSDAITGITYDGWSYNYELNEGKGVRLRNVTVGERAVVKEGQVEIDVPDSSAVILSFGKGY